MFSDVTTIILESGLPYKIFAGSLAEKILKESMIKTVDKQTIQDENQINTNKTKQ